MKTTMRDLIIEASRSSGRTQIECEAVARDLLNLISTRVMVRGDAIEIRGFGSFVRKTRKPRNARNPRTGDIVPLPPCRIMKWKPSPDLKHAVTQGVPHEPDHP